VPFAAKQTVFVYRLAAFAALQTAFDSRLAPVAACSCREIRVTSRLFRVSCSFCRVKKTGKRDNLAQPFCATRCAAGIWLQMPCIP
jgi:hypothetical protein